MSLIDEAKGAINWWDRKGVSADVVAAIIEAKATLALAEQVKVANMIALGQPVKTPEGGEVAFEVWQFRRNDTGYPEVRLNPDIAAALGIGDSDE